MRREKIKFSDFLRGTHKSGAAKMRAEFKYKKHCVTLKEKIIVNINCQLSIISYFCMRIDVDRFVLLATHGKNAKNKRF